MGSSRRSLALNLGDHRRARERCRASLGLAGQPIRGLYVETILSLLQEGRVMILVSDGKWRGTLGLMLTDIASGGRWQILECEKNRLKCRNVSRQSVAEALLQTVACDGMQVVPGARDAYFTALRAAFRDLGEATEREWLERVEHDAKKAREWCTKVSRLVSI